MTLVMWRDWDARVSWDQQIILDLTSDVRYEHRQMHWTYEGYQQGAVVVIPGQHYFRAADLFAKNIAGLPWALTIVCSDEEALFPVDCLPRDASHAVFTQYHDRGMDRVIPIGARPQTKETIQSHPVETVAGGPARDLSVWFAGQDTHDRRHELLAAMEEMACDVRRYGNVEWATTMGFQQGLSQDRYLAAMSRTKLAPCPSGPHSLDSFRLYEAIAAGALPIIETHTPQGLEIGLWIKMFGWECPIPCVSTWKELPNIAEQLSDPEVWRAKRDEVQAWWTGFRADLQADFDRTIERLATAATLDDTRTIR